MRARTYIEELGSRMGDVKSLAALSELELLGLVAPAGALRPRPRSSYDGRRFIGCTVARVPVRLSIAGSDSGGGAGIQADIQGFCPLRRPWHHAITAVTAQNTVAVTGSTRYLRR